MREEMRETGRGACAAEGCGADGMGRMIGEKNGRRIETTACTQLNKNKTHL